MSIGNPWSLKKIRSGKKHHSIGISLQCIFEQNHPVDDRFVGYQTGYSWEKDESTKSAILAHTGGRRETYLKSMWSLSFLANWKLTSIKAKSKYTARHLNIMSVDCLNLCTEIHLQAFLMRLIVASLFHQYLCLHHHTMMNTRLQ